MAVKGKVIDPARAKRVVALKTHFADHSLRFVLSKQQWGTWTNIPALAWQAVAFDTASKPTVPASRGVYCFVARPRGGGYPTGLGYPLYVGETGDVSKAELRTRFGQYLDEAAGKGRTKMYEWLDKLRDQVDFAYAVVADTTVQLKSIEKKLSDALIPPLSDKDFSAEVREAVKAFRR